MIINLEPMIMDAGICVALGIITVMALSAWVTVPIGAFQIVATSWLIYLAKHIAREAQPDIFFAELEPEGGDDDPSN